MTAIQTVRRTRATLALAGAGQAVAWGSAAGFFLLAALAFAAKLFPSVANASGWPIVAAIVSGLITSGALLWRSRHVVSPDRVALWLEERIPGLEYSLVTAMDPRYRHLSGGIEAAVARAPIGHETSRALWKALLPGLAAVFAAAALLYVSPLSSSGAGLFGARRGFGTAAEVPAGSRLEGLRVRVIPPAYTGQSAVSLDDPSSISGLPASRIVVSGAGPQAGITASVATSTARAAAAGGRWSVSIVMPPKPAALTLRDRVFERIIVLEPRADRPPRIVLTAPARDTTMRVARFVVDLSATATDDIGLRGAWFEYLVTTGAGEIFSARTINTPLVVFGGARTGSMNAILDLASLKLGQGDVVSIRAITHDVNTLSGPGIGTSDTRTFRIARDNEYDSVAVDAAAPPPVDSSAISQRMLIQMTEQLVKDQRNLARAELVRRSTEIGDLEDRIRKKVEAILYQKVEEEGENTEGEGEPPQPHIEAHAHSDQVEAVANADLKEAHNALWQAVRSLQIAEPAPALPPMRIALKALDRARLANRLYLRGVPPRIVVDLQRVRMTGKEKGSASTRTPRTAADSLRERLDRRFSEALEMIQRSPEGAVRAFTLLRVDALSEAPAFASALSEAIDAFRNGRDATNPLLRARRALAGDPRAVPGLPSWSGDW
ncbi:MAG: hypothetical protein H0T48_13290 [Gemmatimonadaceae bacterium]|nr:hypothetical protein [Gemmatimonadaceae bacterium]